MGRGEGGEGQDRHNSVRISWHQLMVPQVVQAAPPGSASNHVSALSCWNQGCRELHSFFVWEADKARVLRVESTLHEGPYRPGSSLESRVGQTS